MSFIDQLLLVGGIIIKHNIFSDFGVFLPENNIVQESKVFETILRCTCIGLFPSGGLERHPFLQVGL